MVTEDAQLYTIEGIAAAFMIVVTAYLVVSTTTVLTQQDVHIIDLQLQQLGNDALAMMDSPDSYGENSILTDAVIKVVSSNDSLLFRQTFLGYVNNATNVAVPSYDRINYSAVIYYLNTSNQINQTLVGGGTYYRENSVKVSRWVFLPKGSLHVTDMNNSVNRSVLLEVQLWRE
ncbi:MAG: DUF7288 family protein [Methanomicrobiales archaeon]|nr:hypothetical protein [Methanoregulaceae archaeon]HPX73540.1 hypothetical protein [Methanoregulaceae archaeon]HQA80764.1 hypothetical protein [Methanoregulaceae archaeon]